MFLVAIKDNTTKGIACRNSSPIGDLVYARIATALFILERIALDYFFSLRFFHQSTSRFASTPVPRFIKKVAIADNIVITSNPLGVGGATKVLYHKRWCFARLRLTERHGCGIVIAKL